MQTVKEQERLIRASIGKNVDIKMQVLHVESAEDGIDIRQCPDCCEFYYTCQVVMIGDLHIAACVNDVEVEGEVHCMHPCLTTLHLPREES